MRAAISRPGQLSDTTQDWRFERETQLGSISGASEPWKISVLILEDEAADAEMLARTLGSMEEYHADVSHAWSLSEARQQIARHRFDVALIDYHVGDGLGDELLSDLSTNAPFCAPIMISGVDMAEVSLFGLKGGAVGALNKHRIETDLMETTIRFALREKRHLREFHRLEAQNANFRRRLDRTYTIVQQMLTDSFGAAMDYADQLEEAIADRTNADDLHDPAIGLRLTLSCLLEDVQSLVSAQDLPTISRCDSVDVGESIAEALVISRHRCRQRGIRIFTEFLAERSPVHADRLLLRQALTTLLTLAISRSPDHGEVKMMLKQHDGQIRLRIVDQASAPSTPGLISTSYHPEVGWRRQLPAPASDEEQSTLAKVANILNLFEGRVRFAPTDVGVGRPIDVTLPLCSHPHCGG